jgi:hypothetical protein
MLTPIDFITNGLSDEQVKYLEFFPLNDQCNIKSQYFNESFEKTSTQLSDYKQIMSSLFATHSDQSDIVFPGLRYNNNGVAVFERPPSMKVFSYIPEYRDSIGSHSSFEEYYLPIPWQVYVAKYNPNDMRLIDVRMFFSESSLTSIDQHLYAPPILNFYANGELCRPFFSSIEDIEKYPQNISGIMASAYDWIWNSGYNYDITHNLSEFIIQKHYDKLYELAENKSSLKKYYNYLSSNTLTYSPTNLSGSYVLSLYKIWEQVPLNRIGEVTWNNACSSTFVFQEYDHRKSDLAYTWASNKNYTLIEDLEDPDEVDLDDDQYISLDQIYEDYDFHKYAYEAIRNIPMKLKSVLIDSYSFLIANRILIPSFISPSRTEAITNNKIFSAIMSVPQILSS